MPQISLYLDKKTMDLVEKMAKISHKSISKWVSDQLKVSVKDSWPDNFFEKFGALDAADFGEINDLSFNDDSKRESL